MRSGRAVFQTTCANCHRLFGAGGTIAPDLTGSGRHNLDYLLENIVDPSAVVNKDFRMSVLRMADGRMLNGLVMSQDDERVVLQTAKEKLTLMRNEIDEIKLTTLSPMPEGILQPLKPDQIRDLMAYLMSPSQVDLPPDPAVMHQRREQVHRRDNDDDADDVEHQAIGHHRSQRNAAGAIDDRVAGRRNGQHEAEAGAERRGQSRLQRIDARGLGDADDDRHDHGGGRGVGRDFGDQRRRDRCQRDEAERAMRRNRLPPGLGPPPGPGPFATRGRPGSSRRRKSG